MNLKKTISAVMAALTAVSMSVVPAFASPGNFRCAVCDTQVYCELAKNSGTYQDYFEVPDIEGLTNSDGYNYIIDDEVSSLGIVEYNDAYLCFTHLEEKINEYKESLSNNNNQSSSTVITATVPSSYTIVVPDTVAMTSTGKNGEMSATIPVTIKGDIADNQKVSVSASAPTMSRTGSADVAATLTAPSSTEWSRSDCSGDGTSRNYTVSASLSPGDWSGILTFNCSLAS